MAVAPIPGQGLGGLGGRRWVSQAPASWAGGAGRGPGGKGLPGFPLCLYLEQRHFLALSTGRGPGPQAHFQQLLPHVPALPRQGPQLGGLGLGAERLPAQPGGPIQGLSARPSASYRLVPLTSPILSPILPSSPSLDSSLTTPSACSLPLCLLPLPLRGSLHLRLPAYPPASLPLPIPCPPFCLAGCHLAIE